MTSLFRQILETVLFPADASEGLILIAEPEPSSEQDRKITGEYYVPKDFFPPVCEARSIPGGDDLVSALRAIMSQICPSRLFMFPPFLSPRFVPEGLRTEYPGLSLEEIALQVVVDTLAPGSLVGTLLPTVFFSGERSRAFRERLFREANPRLVITHDHSWQEFGIHPAFRMNSLVIEVGQQGQPILRFFKYPETVDAKQQMEIISDLQRLLRQGGGRTRYGYVLRNGLPPGAALLHDMYHPDLVSRQEEMSHFGGVRPLGELVDAYRGVQRVKGADWLYEADDDRGVPAIEGRHIRADGNIALEELRYRAQVPSTHHLQASDFCLRRITGNTQRLYVAQIEEHMLPLVALDTVYSSLGRSHPQPPRIESYCLLTYAQESLPSS